jgi:hypothetical protein
MAENSNVFQKFAPGQIWNFRLQQCAATDEKLRPYLILGAVKRRLILIRLTHEGEFSSNWIYTIKNDDGTSSNFIVDCPIVVNPWDIKDQINADDLRILKRQEFLAIVKMFIAMIIYNSTYEDMLLTESSINDIKEEISRHEETMYSFSRYGTYNDVTKISSPFKIKTPIMEVPPIEVQEEITENDTEDNEDTDEEDVEEIDNIGEDIDDDNDAARRQYHNYKTTIASLKIEDIVIFGEGSTSLEDINKACDQFGIKNPKFELSTLCQRKRCAYVGGKYNFTLKMYFNKDKNADKRKARNFKKVKRTLIEDVDNFGAAVTASIWGTSTATIYYYAKNKTK